MVYTDAYAASKDATVHGQQTVVYGHFATSDQTVSIGDKSREHADQDTS